MSKQIYVPTMDELYTIQDMNINIYNYLQAKVIEILSLEGTVTHKGILEHEYKYFRENPEIVRAVCFMFPNELKYSEIGKYDIDLCLDLLDQKDSPIYNLDRLSLFHESTINNRAVTRTVIDILSRELAKNPKYRFEYTENELVNNIFNTEFMNNLFYESKMIEDLSRIEPAYVLKDKNITDKKELLDKAIKSYIRRYKLSPYEGTTLEYEGKDILTNPDQNTKRLIRCIEKRGNKKY